MGRPKQYLGLHLEHTMPPGLLEPLKNGNSVDYLTRPGDGWEQDLGIPNEFPIPRSHVLTRNPLDILLETSQS